MFFEQNALLYESYSKITDMLYSNKFSLELLLEEDDLIDEVKSRNSPLINVLASYDYLRQMIVYVIETPEEGADVMRRIKYPYMSCQVICCDVHEISSNLQMRLIELLFTFLDQDTVDVTLAGYFSKIVSLVLVRKPNDIAKFIHENSTKLLKRFMKHLGNYSIAQVFKSLLQPLDGAGEALDTYEDGDEFGLTNLSLHVREEENTHKVRIDLDWFSDKKVVLVLLRLLTVSKDRNVHAHIGEILVEVIQDGMRGREVDKDHECPLLDAFEEKDVNFKVVKACFPEKYCYSSDVSAALLIVSALLARHSSPKYPDPCGERLPRIVNSVIIYRIQMKTLLKATCRELLESQNGEHLETLGFLRLKTIDLLVLLIQTKFHQVDTAIIGQEFPSICLDIFFKFDLVNLMHSRVESMVITALESGSPALRKSFVVDARLFERLLDAYEQNNAKEFKYRKGYMGHVIRILNFIKSLYDDCTAESEADVDSSSLDRMAHSDEITELFQEHPVWPRMTAFFENDLPKINAIQNKMVGGPPPKTNSAEDSYNYEAYAALGDAPLISTEEFDNSISNINDEVADQTLTEIDYDIMHLPDQNILDSDHPDTIPTLQHESPIVYSSSSSSSDDDEYTEAPQEMAQQDATENPPPSPTKTKSDTQNEQATAPMDTKQDDDSNLQEDWADFKIVPGDT